MTENKVSIACLITTGDYYYGDPPPSYEAGYGEFVAWQEAQFKKRKRKMPKVRLT